MTEVATTVPTSRNAAAAMALRIAGAGFEEIATALGFESADTARKAIELDLAARAADADPKAREEQRALAAARLERLLRAVWQKATSPMDPEQLPASRVALALIDRHIRLYGLDAPVEHVIYTPAASEIEQWVARMLGEQQALYEQEPDVVVIEGEVVRDGEAAQERSA
jgi:hypothetical protein